MVPKPPLYGERKRQEQTGNKDIDRANAGANAGGFKTPLQSDFFKPARRNIKNTTIRPEYADFFKNQSEQQIEETMNDPEAAHLFEDKILAQGMITSDDEEDTKDYLKNNCKYIFNKKF